MVVATGGLANIFAVVILHSTTVIAQNEMKCNCKCNQQNNNSSVNEAYNTTKNDFDKAGNYTDSGAMALRLKSHEASEIIKTLLDRVEENESDDSYQAPYKNYTDDNTISWTTPRGSLFSDIGTTLKIAGNGQVNGSDLRQVQCSQNNTFIDSKEKTNTPVQNTTTGYEMAVNPTRNDSELLSEDTKNHIVVDKRTQRGDIEINETEDTVQEPTNLPETVIETQTEVSISANSVNVLVKEGTSSPEAVINNQTEVLEKTTTEKYKTTKDRKQTMSVVQKPPFPTNSIKTQLNLETTKKAHLFQNNDTFNSTVNNGPYTISPLIDMFVRYLVHMENKRLDNDE